MSVILSNAQRTAPLSLNSLVLDFPANANADVDVDTQLGFRKPSRAEVARAEWRKSNRAQAKNVLCMNFLPEPLCREARKVHCTVEVLPPPAKNAAKRIPFRRLCCQRTHGAHGSAATHHAACSAE